MAVEGAPWTCSVLLTYQAFKPDSRVDNHERSRCGTEASTVTRDKEQVIGSSSTDDTFALTSCLTSGAIRGLKRAWHEVAERPGATSAAHSNVDYGDVPATHFTTNNA